MSEFEGSVQLLFGIFLKGLKHAEIGLAVTKNGDFIFNDRNTNEKVAFTAEAIEKAYNGK